MKSIVNKALYSLGGTFKTIGRNIGHLYEIIASKIIHISGTNFSVNDTINAPMKIELSPSELTQTTYTGKNLAHDITYINALNQYWPVVNATYDVVENQYYAISFDTPNTGIKGYVNYLEQMLLTRIGDYPSFTCDGTRKTFIAQGNTTGTANNVSIIGRSTATSETGIGLLSNLMIEPIPSASATSTSYEPYTGGTASPNPQYPQDIHTISGSNTIEINGENLCNTFIATKPSWQSGTLVVNSDGSFTVSGNTGSNNYFSLDQKLKELCPSLKNGDTAYLFLDTTNTNKRIYISGMGGAGWFDSASLTITDALLNGSVVIYGGYNQTDTIKMAITKGQVATKYTPYQKPQEADIDLGDIEYCKKGNYRDKFIRTSGKNLLKINDFTYNDNGLTYKAENGIIRITGTAIGSASSISMKDYINLQELNNIANGTMLTFSVLDIKGLAATQIWLGTTNNGYLYQPNSSTKKVSVEKDSDFNKFNMWFSTTANQYYDIYINPQLELGSNATEYEPYGTNEWYIKKNIGKVVLDGNETWDNFQIESSGLGRAIVSSSNVYYETNQNTIMASNMVGVQYSGSWNNTYDCIASYSNNRFIAYLKNASDLATFKSILNNSNAIVNYILATPIYIPITGTLKNQLENVYQKLKSYTGTTNISQINHDLPFELEIDINIEE